MRYFIAFAFVTITGFIVFKAASTATAQSISTVENPVVVELFTSQSCSSCPPADRLLGQLAENENIIALSCNVTYWNHLHWKDTLSKDFCTQRQRQYTRSLKSRGPYTPQMVINGHHDVVGNRSLQVSNIISDAGKNEPIAPITIQDTEGFLKINLAKNKNKDLTLTIFSFEKEHTQSIPSGENGGRTISYTNPVSNIGDLGLWDGSNKTIEVKNNNPSGGYIVLAQDKGGYGKIVAAGQIKF